MTEAEFLTSNDPAAMLEWLRNYEGRLAARLDPDPPSERKLRLFACAACRSVWPLLTDPRSRRAVEVAERYADGEATEAEWKSAGDTAYRALPNSPGFTVHDLVGLTATSNFGRSLEEFDGWQNEFIPAAVQAGILRDLAGNPWRPVVLDSRTCPNAGCGKPMHFYDTSEYRSGQWECTGCTRLDTAEETFTAAWREGRVFRREWITPTVLALATAAYRERLATDTLDPFRLGLVADALEDAGCGGTWGDCGRCGGRGGTGYGKFGVCPDCKGKGRVLTPHPIVDHLRSPGPHWRGCWAVDAVRGIHD